MTTRRILRILSVTGGAAMLLGLALPVYAQDAAPPAISGGDTAWMLTSAALVMMMTVPGLALFYDGLVSHRNALSTLMHSFLGGEMSSMTYNG